VDYHEISCAFASHAEWQAFSAANPWLIDPVYIQQVVEQVRHHGLRSEFHGDTPALDVEIIGDNYRETLTARGCTSRVRMVLDLLYQELGDDLSRRILMLEGVTPFALAVRGRWPFAVGTEYAPTAELRRAIFPIPHCDIQDCDYEAGVFDAVVSNDVLEHVPDLQAAVRETKRILKPGGVMIATFPFTFLQETQVKARFEAGGIVHLMEPEYHGNPIDPEAGSLVFQVPGWDILDLCRAAGFRRAEMIFISSAARGIVGARFAGGLVLRAQT
jgi:SAM-dependent methyltransferase